MKKSKNIFFLCILLPLAVGLLSALLAGQITGQSGAFYSSLTLPPLAPPGYIFPIVWMILYVLMGVSSYVIYETEHPKRESALVQYGNQLFVNFLWTPIFFRFEQIGIALLVLILLTYLVWRMIQSFKHINPTASYLQIPYFLWCCFALYLNIGLFVLNI